MLLASTVFLLIIAETIPPQSARVPVICEYMYMCSVQWHDIGTFKNIYDYLNYFDDVIGIRARN